MPELPEVQTTVDGLNAKVLNRAFIDVWSDWEKMVRLRSNFFTASAGQVKKPKDFDIFKKELKGKKIKKVWRRAKNVIFELSGGYSLLIHMKMTGHLMVGRWQADGDSWQPLSNEAFKEKINGFLHIIFFLENKDMIALSDVRKFSKIELWKTPEFLQSKEFLGWGPEPLDEDFTLAKFKEILKKKKGKVKQVIMVPQVIAGIGNIYASEALWRAKIHPEKNVTKLTGKELKALHDSIRKVLKAGIDFGGDSFSDYRNVNGQKGEFEGQKHAYQREGEKCFRCKAIIVRKTIGGRSAFFCPTCQAL